MDFFSLFRKRKVFHSSINGDVTLGEVAGRKALLTGKITQSGGELVRMWEHVISHISKSRFKARSFLLLGVGGGMGFTVVKKFYPKISLTGVDIDPVILDMGRKHFDLKYHPNANIIIDDAVSWVNNREHKKRYDLILVDLYIGALNAPETRNKKFLKGIRQLVTQHGIVLYNCDFRQHDTKKYTSYKKLCERYFKQVQEVFSYPLNRVLLLQN